MSTKVSVVGLGKLGFPLACCWADAGFDTIAIDLNEELVDALNDGKAPYYESNLQDYLTRNKDKLEATTDISRVVDTDISFIIVPTPSVEDNSFTNDYILSATDKLSYILKEKGSYHTVVIVSTVMPGSMDSVIKTSLEQSGIRMGEDFGLSYNPEFIALGSVIRDLQNPDMLLIGESDEKTGDFLEKLYKQFCKNTPMVARMNFVNAELVKLLLNTFVTMKISYANMISQLCESMSGANVDVITSALGMDSRIGKKYLKGGLGYGGPCFPRDNLALLKAAEKVNLSANLAKATHSFNLDHTLHLKESILKKIDKKQTVGILGLTYKPDTNVTEASQGVFLAESLIKEGIETIVYDPAGKINLPTASSANELIEKSDAVVIATPWPQFIELNYSNKTVFDCWRIIKTKPEQYIPLGIGIDNTECAHSTTS